MPWSALPKDVLTFGLGPTLYGVDLRRVHEVHDVPLPVRAPGDLSIYRIDIAGSVLPMLDKRMHFAPATSAVTDPVKVLVLLGQNGRVAMAVDDVADVIRLNPTWIEPSEANACSMGTRFVVDLDEPPGKLAIICVDRLLARAAANGWPVAMAA